MAQSLGLSTYQKYGGVVEKIWVGTVLEKSDEKCFIRIGKYFFGRFAFGNILYSKPVSIIP